MPLFTKSCLPSWGSPSYPDSLQLYHESPKSLGPVAGSGLSRGAGQC